MTYQPPDAPTATRNRESRNVSSFALRAYTMGGTPLSLRRRLSPAPRRTQSLEPSRSRRRHRENAVAVRRRRRRAEGRERREGHASRACGSRPVAEGRGSSRARAAGLRPVSLGIRRFRAASSTDAAGYRRPRETRGGEAGARKSVHRSWMRARCDRQRWRLQALLEAGGATSHQRPPPEQDLRTSRCRSRRSATSA